MYQEYLSVVASLTVLSFKVKYYLNLKVKRGLSLWKNSSTSIKRWAGIARGLSIFIFAMDT